MCSEAYPIICLFDGFALLNSNEEGIPTMKEGKEECHTPFRFSHQLLQHTAKIKMGIYDLCNVYFCRKVLN